MNRMRKNDNVELMRGIAAMAIVSGHMGLFGMDVQRPFRDSWYFVELFFCWQATLLCNISAK